MDFLPDAFAALASYQQFVVYKVVPSKTRPGKFDKISLDWRTGLNCDAHDAHNWTTVDNAIAIAKLFGEGYGVGFVLTKDDPFFCIDIDSCRIDTGWSDIAMQLCTMFQGAAIEISQSGNGLHIFGCGECPPHACKNTELDIELYTETRFMALTGHGAMGDITFNATHLLPQLVDTYFKQTATTSGFDLSNWTDKPVAEWSGPADDTILLDRMLKAQSAASIFGTRATFKDIWENNTEVLALNYASSDGTFDQSSVDAALAQHLAFWTGNNCERMLNLMRQSQLVRGKWDRDDYLPRTILSACAKQKTFAKELAVKQQATADDKFKGVNYLNADQQLELFKGCVYVEDQHVIITHEGYALDAQRFDVRYGGFCFALDAVNTKTTPSAWKAFTQSQVLRDVHPKARSAAFDPRLPPLTIIKKQDGDYINTYREIKTPRVKGDATRFITHLHKMFDNERDVTILTSYMAAILQYKGHKFEWCPIIQGIQGNGKSTLSDIIQFGVSDTYTHQPEQASIKNKFNLWLERKIFIRVEEVYDRERLLIEPLKTMITSDKIAIEPKGKEQVTRGICCNFIILTNHKDGLQKHCNDRRLAPFYSRQQYAGDLERDGLTEEYFAEFDHWLKQENGYAITCDYLENYQIPREFNPMYKRRAPCTSSTVEAVEHGRTNIEQEIVEAIEQEKIGFRKGWVSSYQLDALLQGLRLNSQMGHVKRREIMRELGYMLHPGLKEGRVNNIVQPDNGKPRLFIKLDHYTRDLKIAAEIQRAYSADQGS